MPFSSQSLRALSLSKNGNVHRDGREATLEDAGKFSEQSRESWKLRLRNAGPVKQTFCCALFVILLLELWRPLCFLTDDNLTYWLPIVVEMGRNMARGASPFINTHLYGGYYDLLRDPTSLSLWNPVLLSLSFLGNTRGFIYLVDIYAAFNLLLCATGFAFLLERLRHWRALELSDGRIVFLSLSYSFSAFALTVGASWVMFLANMAMLPILFLGILHPQRRVGIVLVMTSCVWGIIAGHVSPFLFTVLFTTLFVLILSFGERNAEPLLRWAAGGFLALLILAPILWPSFSGFAGGSRQAEISIARASHWRVALPVQISSFFGGYVIALPSLFLLDKLFWGQAFASCAGAYLVFHQLRARRKVDALQVALLVTGFVVIVFVDRPLWLGEAISHVPLYRSLRWPFRELFNVLFFVHLWIALRPVGLSRAACNMTSLASVGVFLLSLVSFNEWSLAVMPQDRDLIVSGQAGAYWDDLRKKLGPDDRIIPIIPREIIEPNFYFIPYSLVGAYNYPALFEVKAVAGYTAQGFARWKDSDLLPYHWSGTFSEQVGQKLMEQDSRVKALKMVSFRPLHIEFCDAGGCEKVSLPPLATQRVWNRKLR